MLNTWVAAVGRWWLGLIALPLDLLAVYGISVPRLPFGVVTSIGLVLVIVGSFRAYKRVSGERDALKPQVYLTIEVPETPRREMFGGTKGVIVPNVWVQDHLRVADDERGVLDFQLILEWSGKRWFFDKDPFQEIYRNSAEDIRNLYFSIPWDVKKNFRRHLIFVEREPALIPDQAMSHFTLRVRDIDVAHWFDIRRPGIHHLKVGLNGKPEQSYEATSS